MIERSARESCCVSGCVLLKTCWILALAAVLPSALFGQTKPDEPIKITLCELAKAPERFDNKVVEIRSEFLSRFEWEGFVDESCSAKVPVGAYHAYDGLKPEQGQFAFTTVDDDNTHPERLNWKPIERRLRVGLKQDANYRAFRKYADTKFRWSDGGVCRDCPLYKIIVTAVGRFDYFPTQTVSVRANSTTRAFHYSAGESNVPLLRLILSSISNVVATPIDASVYTGKKGRDLTVEEAHELVTALIRDRRSSGFSLEPYLVNDYPGFQFFQVLGDDPNGEVHYPVDLKTGEVWGEASCQTMTSPALMKLQTAIRNRIGMTADESRKVRRPGPFCER
jgi:hypothetical protein